MVKSAARKPTSWQKSQRDANVNAKTLQRHINKVWNAASKAPMFRREVEKDGKVTRRSVRLIQGHAYNIAVAGAVAAAVKDLKTDCDKWGLEYPETSKHPFMLGVPAGTKLMLEQFLSAYVATGVLKATRMMKAPETPKHKRLNKIYIKRSFEYLNESIQSNSGSTRAGCVIPLKVKKAGGDYQPPAVEEQEEAVAEE
jgi:hypothetical protein